MAKHDLTPLQDVTTREFLTQVALAENTLPDTPGLKKQLTAICYQLLNYDRLSDGRFITKGTKVKMPFGDMPSLETYPDEWPEDYDRALTALDEQGGIYERAAIDTDNPAETNSGKQAKNTSLWKALFSKDV